MKAAVSTRYGPPDVVEIREVDPPEVRDEDVLIRVRATTVNRTDCAYRAARPFFMRAATGLRRPRRPILGTEYAGVVESVGPAVTAFAPGDRVFGYNEGRLGAHAEFLAVSQTAPLAPIPAGVTFRAAAPATEGAHYALAILRTGRIRAGQRVLVYGATGAIGSAAVQLLKAIDVRVTAVCGPDQIELVRGLGADRVVDYVAEDFTADRTAYDAVIDAVGKSTFGRCRRLLRPRGRYLSTELGPWSQNIWLALTTPAFGGRRVTFPFPRQDQPMIRHLADLIRSGLFTPVVDRTYPLDRIVDAYRFVETGRKIGSVVIDVAPER